MNCKIDLVHRTATRGNSLRIVHLNTYDDTGGAARATYRLHRGLRKLGHDSLMLVAHRKRHDPDVMSFVEPMDFMTRVRRRIRAERIKRGFSLYRHTRPAGYEKFTDDRTLAGSDLLSQLPPCDVVNLHWIADFVDLQSLFSVLPHHVPIFWRLSDMNPLTGGCHFDDGCGRYANGCGLCPQLGSSDGQDLSRQIWRRKQAVFETVDPARLHLIALNRWMADQARRSPLLDKFPVTIVPNGVDTEVFGPQDRRKARDFLGIPQDRQVVLFAAEAVTNRRKGLALLTAALAKLQKPENLLLLSVGRGAPKISIDIPHSHLTHVDDDRRLAAIYSAADLYVIPSLQDNQPNTVLEAMACGTPVIGFAVGGISDMVRPGITGLLTPVGDVTGLATAIMEMLRCTDKRRTMGAACRRVVLDEYTRELQVDRYVRLYRAALERYSLAISQVAEAGSAVH